MGINANWNCPFSIFSKRFLSISLQVFPDNFMRREVHSFVVHCTFMDDGCKWKGEVRHLEVCG